MFQCIHQHTSSKHSSSPKDTHGYREHSNTMHSCHHEPNLLAWTYTCRLIPPADLMAIHPIITLHLHSMISTQPFTNRHCWRPVIPEIPKPVGQEVACLAKGIRASKIKNFVLYEIVCKFKIWIRFRREENLKFLLRFEWIQNRKSCSCFGDSKTLCL